MRALQINDLTTKVEKVENSPISTFFEPSMPSVASSIRSEEQIQKVVEVERGRDTPKKRCNFRFMTEASPRHPQSDEEIYLNRFQDKSYSTHYWTRLALKTFQDYLFCTRKKFVNAEDTKPFLKHSFQFLYQNMQSLAERTYWRVLQVLRVYLSPESLYKRMGTNRPQDASLNKDTTARFLHITREEVCSHYKDFLKNKQEEHRKRYYNQEEILRAYKRYLLERHNEYSILQEKEVQLQKFLRHLNSQGLSLYTVEEPFIKEWQKDLLQNRDYSADYQVKLLRAVKLFFDWFCKQGYRKEHPFPKYHFLEYKKEILPLCFSRRSGRFDRVPEQFRKFFDSASLYEESLSLGSPTRYVHKVGWEFFFKYLERERIFKIEEVDELILEKYLLFLVAYRNAKENVLSLNVRCRHIIALKRLFSYLSRFRHIPRDPACAIELPKNPRGLPTSNIKEREVQLLLESVSTENPLGLRDRAILETLYSTGVRNKELRYVKAQDIDFEMGLLRVNNPKGGALYQRVIAIGKTALYWVQQYLRKSRPLLLKWRNGERGNGEGGIGETFVNKSFPKPFQKTLTGSHAVLGTACDQKKLRKKSYPPVTASDQKTLTGEKVLNGEKALNGKNFKMQHWRESDYLFLNKAGGQMSATGLLGVVKNALLRARIRNPSIVTHSFRVACATGMLKGKGQSMKGADIKWVQEQLGHTNIQSTSKYLRLVPGELKKIHTLYHPRESSRKVPPKTTKTNL